MSATEKCPETCPFCGAKYRYRMPHPNGPSLFECHSWSDQRSELCKKRTQRIKLEGEVAKAVGIARELSGFAEHAPHCVFDYKPYAPCDCGLSDILGELDNLEFSAKQQLEAGK